MLGPLLHLRLGGSVAGSAGSFFFTTAAATMAAACARFAAGTDQSWAAEVLAPAGLLLTSSPCSSRASRAMLHDGRVDCQSAVLFNMHTNDPGLRLRSCAQEHYTSAGCIRVQCSSLAVSTGMPQPLAPANKLWVGFSLLDLARGRGIQLLGAQAAAIRRLLARC